MSLTDSERVATCVTDIADRMCSYRLQLNIDKTSLLWCPSYRCQHQLPSATLSFSGSDITASSVEGKRGVFFNSDLSLRHHVDVITERCFRCQVCSDDEIAGDVTDPYVARLLQQRPLRTPGCPHF
jgi:hypothetical protein